MRLVLFELLSAESLLKTVCILNLAFSKVRTKTRRQSVKNNVLFSNLFLDEDKCEKKAHAVSS